MGSCCSKHEGAHAKVLEEVSRNGLHLKLVSEELKNNKEVVLKACSQHGYALEHASHGLKNDKQVVLAACYQNGDALEHASEQLKNDKEVVLAACSNNAYALRYASEALKNDKDIVVAACSQDGDALLQASDGLKNDKEVVLAACSKNGYALEHASHKLKNDKQVVLAACSQDGCALEYASQQLRNDKDIVLAACSQNCYALGCASEGIKNDKGVVLEACSRNGKALQYASEKLKNDKKIVIVACSQDGDALQFASESLRADKEVVITAVECKPVSLMFALGGLNQDKDCLIKCGLWDADHIDGETTSNVKSDKPWNIPMKIVLSTKFSLSAESSDHATQFTLELKKHPRIADKNVVVYSPNAFNKGTCDPNWTDKTWPCRGTYDSCQKPPHLKTGVPQEAVCCWRYSFRYQLEEARRSGGFMIQVVDYERNGNNWEHKLGNGQSIEKEMAEDVGTKVFRSFEPKNTFFDSGACAKEADLLVSEIHGQHRMRRRRPTTIDSISDDSLGAVLRRAKDDIMSDNSVSAVLQEMDSLTFQNQDSLSKAFDLIEESRSIQKGQLGTDAEEVGDTINMIGFLQAKRGKLDDAAILFRESLRIRKLLEDRVKVSETLKNIGNVHREEAEHELAIEHYEEFLGIRRSELGDLHEQVADALIAMGNIQNDMEYPEEAAHSYCEALEIRKTLYGENDTRVAAVMRRIGSLEFQNGEHEKALGMLTEYVRIRQENDSENDGDHVNVLFMIGNIHKMQGKEDEAKKWWTDAYAIFQELGLAEGNPQVAQVMENLLGKQQEQSFFGGLVDKVIWMNR